MGGYNRANMVRAAEGTVAVPDANKTTEGFRGDPTTQWRLALNYFGYRGVT